LFTTRTFREFFEPQGVKNNYSQPQGPTVQLLLLLLFFSQMVLELLKETEIILSSKTNEFQRHRQVTHLKLRYLMLDVM
jgi:hypothetical protein